MTDAATSEDRVQLAHDLARKLQAEAWRAVEADDIERFAAVAFPWGEGELAEDPGPDAWQAGALAAVNEGLRAGNIVQVGVSSGHGVGKSAFICICILFVMLHQRARGVVTANTGSQLDTKTWPELAKWHRLCNIGHALAWSATSLRCADRTRPDAANWRCDAVTWSEDSPAAFAGLHNAGSWIVLVMDEASEIPAIIWETAEGALTDDATRILWIACGNRTQPTGRFNDCFGRLAHRWRTFCVDSREARKSNKAKIAEWIEDYGEDSDFVRVRVRGLPPSVPATALIGQDEVEAAMRRKLTPQEWEWQAKVVGVDVARQGDDCTVIRVRQGRRAWPPIKLRVPDAVLVAGQVARVVEEHRPDAVFVDGTGGWGAGVVDALRSMSVPCTEVQFAGRADEPDLHHNKRSEMWWRMAAWLRQGGYVPRDEGLKQELCAATYGHRGNKFELCPKDEIKQVIGRSPDDADALALTFAYPVAPGTILAHAGLKPGRAVTEPDDERRS